MKIDLENCLIPDAYTENTNHDICLVDGTLAFSEHNITDALNWLFLNGYINTPSIDLAQWEHIDQISNDVKYHKHDSVYYVDIPFNQYSKNFPDLIELSIKKDSDIRYCIVMPRGKDVYSIDYWMVSYHKATDGFPYTYGGLQSFASLVDMGFYPSSSAYGIDEIGETSYFDAISEYTSNVLNAFFNRRDLQAD